MQPHIHLDASLQASYAILPGDPARVERIAAFLEQPRELGFHREYRSVCGVWRGVRVLAMSTGMGGPSTAIAVEELRKIGVHTLLRIGSSGALNAKVGLGDLLLVQGAVRDDGASRAYVTPGYPAVPDWSVLTACVHSARENGAPYHVGLVRSHDSFYIDGQDALNREWSARGVLGSDMETAALLTVAGLRGMRAGSILNNVVQWGESTLQSIGSYAGGEALTARGERNSILTALDACALLEAQEARGI